MDDTYWLETLIWEQRTRMQRQARVQAALQELEQPPRSDGGTLFARLRRAVTTLLPTRSVERTATR